ncbi:type II secretion system F family protein [Caldanaerovirga acetigignens]|nr:type II secretion system F family protein [Caldanaerovirga acetigignens]
MSAQKIAILTFTAVFLALIGLSEIIFPDRKRMNERLRQIGETGVRKKQKVTARQDLRSLWRDFLRWAGNLSPTRTLGRVLDRKLTEADIPLKGGEFIVMVALLAMGSGAFVFAVAFDLKLSLVAGAFSGVIPLIMVNGKRQRWLALFNHQMCDALTLLSTSLRSGFSLMQGMDLVEKELQGPVGKEFGRTLSEIGLGTSTEEALKNMAARVNSRDLDLVVTAVLIQRQVGGNLAEVLDNIASVIRERVNMKREIRALTAQGRMSGLLIGILPLLLCLYIMLTNPPYLLELFTEPLGRIMLVIAIVGEVLGYLTIRKIVDIDV